VHGDIVVNQGWLLQGLGQAIRLCSLKIG